MAVHRDYLIRARPPCTFCIRKREMVGSRTKSLHTQIFDAPPIRLIPSPSIGKKLTGPPYSIMIICSVSPETGVQDVCVHCIGVQGLVSSRFNTRMSLVRSRSRRNARSGWSIDLSAGRSCGCRDHYESRRRVWAERDGERMNGISRFAPSKTRAGDCHVSMTQWPKGSTAKLLPCIASSPQYGKHWAPPDVSDGVLPTPRTSPH